MPFSPGHVCTSVSSMQYLLSPLYKRFLLGWYKNKGFFKRCLFQLICLLTPPPKPKRDKKKISKRWLKHIYSSSTAVEIQSPWSCFICEDSSPLPPPHLPQSSLILQNNIKTEKGVKNLQITEKWFWEPCIGKRLQVSQRTQNSWREDEIVESLKDIQRTLRSLRQNVNID